MYANDYNRQKKMWFKKMISIEHWKYSYGYNQTFTNESNFSIK